jgi:fluoride exporter
MTSDGLGVNDKSAPLRAEFGKPASPGCMRRLSFPAWQDSPMKSYFVVFLGAGCGGALRHAVNLGCMRLYGPGFPWGTLTINAVGSFLMGALAAWLAFRDGEDWTQPARLFLATGVLGGFTTFSAFSLDAVLLWQRGDAGLAAAYVLGSLLLSLGGLVAGLALVRTLAA